MTTAQMNAMRSLSQSLEALSRSMTAREMALTPHNLGRTGDKATVIPTGEVWYWDRTREMWVR